MNKIMNALFQIGGGAVNVRHEKTAYQDACGCTGTDIHCNRYRLWQLLQGEAKRDISPVTAERGCIAC